VSGVVTVLFCLISSYTYSLKPLTRHLLRAWRPLLQGER